MKLRDIECRVCKRLVVRKDKGKNLPKQKYCSSKCYGESIKKYKKCHNCGEEFAIYANSKYCSKSCEGQHKKWKGWE